MLNIPNLRLFIVRYIGPSNTKGARIKIIDTRNKKSIILPRRHMMESTEQAVSFLTSIDIPITHHAWNEMNNETYLLSNCFDKPLKR